MRTGSLVCLPHRWPGLVLPGLLVLLALLALPEAARAQDPPPPVNNPSRVVVESPDHDHPDVTGYRVVYRSVATGAALPSILLPKSAFSPVPNEPGLVQANVNVQPIAMGEYTTEAYVVAAAVESAPRSSPLWRRVPGSPSRVEMR